MEAGPSTLRDYLQAISKVSQPSDIFYNSEPYGEYKDSAILSFLRGNNIDDALRRIIRSVYAKYDEQFKSADKALSLLKISNQSWFQAVEKFRPGSSYAITGAITAFNQKLALHLNMFVRGWIEKRGSLAATKGVSTEATGFIVTLNSELSAKVQRHYGSKIAKTKAVNALLEQSLSTTDQKSPAYEFIKTLKDKEREPDDLNIDVDMQQEAGMIQSKLREWFEAIDDAYSSIKNAPKVTSYAEKVGVINADCDRKQHYRDRYQRLISYYSIGLSVLFVIMMSLSIAAYCLSIPIITLKIILVTLSSTLFCGSLLMLWQLNKINGLHKQPIEPVTADYLQMNELQPANHEELMPHYTLGVSLNAGPS